MPQTFDRYDAQLTTPGLVILEMEATDRHDAARQLAGRLAAEGRIDDLDAFLADVAAREHQMATGLPGGIGLPHARSEHVIRPSIAVGVAKYGHAIDFGALDGPAFVVLLIATPASSFSEHLEVLATMARSLSKAGFRESLRRANDADIISELVNSALLFGD
ncbi:PTS sugar transporter subunit IIA [Sinomonas sp. ASV322]|uniref:PTS sugar transporter subunit IIA n=1 Tax=Sinomonas sp. ASV322 TaxID=3041920 RepID=UPI0027DDF3FC|nr:PTS sugar transporter subunit IIA [Sinomonas sp. ASV322]MDQ4501948.1 PTS sugar transporter subunit IIA [Sinomonas sp. ASV322]